MSKISKISLGDLIEFQRGYDLLKSQFVDGIYPVQSSNGVLGHHNEYKVEGPGVTIGRSGTVGLPHLIKPDFFPHGLQQLPINPNIMKTKPSLKKH